MYCNEAITITPPMWLQYRKGLELFLINQSKQIEFWIQFIHRQRYLGFTIFLAKFLAKQDTVDPPPPFGLVGVTL